MSVLNGLYRTLFGRESLSKGTDIDMAEHGRVGDISTGQSFKHTMKPGVAMKITESGTTTYIAIAPPGTSQSDSLWQVKKLDESSGLVITWADGNTNYDNSATDLTALTYS